MKKVTSALEAVSEIRSNSRVFIHSVACAPRHLINALVQRASELRNVEFVHLHIEGDAPHNRPEYAESFFTNNLFVGANNRQAISEGRADYIPIFLSETPLLFRNGILPLDAALIQVSPPDRHGFCSLGPSVDATRAAVETAKTVIAQINPRVPRTHGDGIIHVRDIHFGFEVDEPLYYHAPGDPTDREMAIGRHCASLVEDGATLQMGIGAIPNATLAALHSHKDLGIHTEMFSDGVLPLVEKGIITNRRKKVHPGKIVGTFVMGTQAIYDFIDDNPSVVLLDVQYVNDTSVIRRNPRVTAINSALEVDLTGQVCADSIGTYQYSGVGGQMDFIRGAARSEGGKAIIALPSITSKGETRIVPWLKQGAGVVTTRAHVHYVVTEFGIAHLYGKNLTQRARALINIAHPDHREQLEKRAFERFKAMLRYS
jgi:acyl-CoA hydrolase